MNSLFLRTTLLSTLFLAACSTTPKAVDNVAKGEPPPTAAASIEAKQLAAEQEANAVAEIKFKRGSHALNAESKMKLRKLLASIPKGQEIDEVKVITWADQEYPNVDQKKLADKQVALVEQRNDSIEKFIKAQSKNVDVDTMSMAERPGKLAQILGGSDVRLKKSLEDAGISSQGDSLKGATKSSQAIILLILKRND